MLHLSEYQLSNIEEYTLMSYMNIAPTATQPKQSKAKTLTPGPLLLTWLNFNPSMDN